MCPICYQDLGIIPLATERPSRYSVHGQRRCSHIICKPCLIKLFDTSDDAMCPVPGCRADWRICFAIRRTRISDKIKCLKNLLQGETCDQWRRYSPVLSKLIEENGFDPYVPFLSFDIDFTLFCFPWNITSDEQEVHRFTTIFSQLFQENGRDPYLPLLSWEEDYTV